MTDWAMSHESSSAQSNEVIRLRNVNEILREALETLVALDDGDDSALWKYETEFNAARAALEKTK